MKKLISETKPVKLKAKTLAYCDQLTENDLEQVTGGVAKNNETVTSLSKSQSDAQSTQPQKLS